MFSENFVTHQQAHSKQVCAVPLARDHGLTAAPFHFFEITFPWSFDMPSLNVNGAVRTYQAEDDTPLLWIWLRRGAMRRLHRPH